MNKPGIRETKTRLARDKNSTTSTQFMDFIGFESEPGRFPPCFGNSSKLNRFQLAERTHRVKRQKGQNVLGLQICSLVYFRGIIFNQKRPLVYFLVFHLASKGLLGTLLIRMLHHIGY